MRVHLAVTTMLVLPLLAAASPASAQHRGAKIAFGYAYSHYLEEGGGSAPLGAFVSVAPRSAGTGFEVDVAYHRDSEDGFVLNTFIAGFGPRHEFGSASANPFLHALAGLRHDRFEGESNTAFGGSAGIGVDLPAGATLALRLGVDFQIFFDEGENLKTLRLTSGIVF